MADSIHYLKRGWAKWYRHEKKANQKALEHFSRASAHAFSAKAWAHFENFDNEWVEKPEDSQKAGIACAEEAVLLLPPNEVADDYRVYWARGYAYLNERKHNESHIAYERAKTLSNPNSDDFDYELLAEMGNLLICMGNTAEAVKNLKTAISKDSRLRRFYLEYLGWAYLENQQLKEAIDTLQASHTKEVPFRIFLAATHAKLGGADNDRRANEIMFEIFGTKDWKPALKDHEDDMKATWHYDLPDERIPKLFVELHGV